MKDGFLRVAAHTPPLRVADCHYNAQQIVEAVRQGDAGTALFVFPELCLTGYTCGDLFRHPALLNGAEEALRELLSQIADTEAVVVVGLPVAVGAALYNCAAVCYRGQLLGLVPKRHLTATDARCFTSGADVCCQVTVAGQEVCLCADVLFTCTNMPSFVLGVELCEDMWVAGQPGIQLAAAGATVIANLSASHDLAGKARYRRSLAETASKRLCCTYVLANAGEGESCADLVFSGGSLIAENGTVVAQTQPFTVGAAVADVDLEHLLHDRRAAFFPQRALDAVPFSLTLRALSLTGVDPHPFVPDDAAQRAEYCEEVLTLQAAALAHRLSHTASEAVVGLSGGLDSALALLVIMRAYQKLGRDAAGITAVTMPCFGTTGRTYRNACTLATACGATLREVNIAQAVTQHFQDIGHGGDYDVTFENVQARERTQVLMDMANQSGGLVVGTGDLSELVLGWATYNGDHMSMYGVNGGVPKTLVRALVAYEAQRLVANSQLSATLRDILDTPVSPELLPPENGDIAQKTEQLVGNYELHDFFLYHMLRYGSNPARIFRLACTAFAGTFSPAEIKQWLGVFLRRFFAQQFKRNCLPDGPKVGEVGVSPRGDWQMPSDATAALWLRELDAL